MSVQRYVTTLFSAAALLALAGLPGTAQATDLAVQTRVAEKPQAAPVARPVVRTVRRPGRWVWRSYRPVRYISRPAAPVRFAALEPRRWQSSWTHMVFLGVGF